MAMLGLHCYTSFSLVVASGGYSLAGQHRLLIAVPSLVVEHGLWVHRLHSVVAARGLWLQLPGPSAQIQ